MPFVTFVSETAHASVLFALRFIRNFALSLTIGGTAVLLVWAWIDWPALRGALVLATTADIRGVIRGGVLMAALWSFLFTFVQWVHRMSQAELASFERADPAESKRCV